MFWLEAILLLLQMGWAYSRYIGLCTSATFFRFGLSLLLNNEVFFNLSRFNNTHSMKNKSLILTGFFFILVAGSCKKNSLAISSDLIGTWQWEYTIGGIATQKTEPENNEITLLNFDADSHFSVTENGNPSLNGTYHITRDTPEGKVIHFSTNYFGDPNGEIYLIKDNALTLIDYRISDGYIHYYKRIK
jgi:hypothetical protein